jgi:hypothetical protein
MQIRTGGTEIKPGEDRHTPATELIRHRWFLNTGVDWGVKKQKN